VKATPTVTKTEKPDSSDVGSQQSTFGERTEKISNAKLESTSASASASASACEGKVGSDTKCPDIRDPVDLLTQPYRRISGPTARSGGAGNGFGEGVPRKATLLLERVMETCLLYMKSYLKGYFHSVGNDNNVGSHDRDRDSGSAGGDGATLLQAATRSVDITSKYAGPSTEPRRSPHEASAMSPFGPRHAEFHVRDDVKLLGSSGRGSSQSTSGGNALTADRHSGGSNVEAFGLGATLSSACECLAAVAFVLQTDFRAYLRQCLYPLIELTVLNVKPSAGMHTYSHTSSYVSDSSPPGSHGESGVSAMVALASGAALKRIALYCGYDDLKHMYRDNLDYIVDIVCLHLRPSPVVDIKKGFRYNFRSGKSAKYYENSTINMGTLARTHRVVGSVLQAVDFHDENNQENVTINEESKAQTLAFGAIMLMKVSDILHTSYTGVFMLKCQYVCSQVYQCVFMETR
jgi:hypothetical protein